MINLGGRVSIHPRPVLGPQAPHRDAKAETSCTSGTLNCRGSRFPDCHQARHAAITIQARFPGQTRIDDEPHPRHRQGGFRNRRRDMTRRTSPGSDKARSCSRADIDPDSPTISTPSSRERRSATTWSTSRAPGTKTSAEAKAHPNDQSRPYHTDAGQAKSPTHATSTITRRNLNKPNKLSPESRKEATTIDRKSVV